MNETATHSDVAVIGRGRLGCALAAALGAPPPHTHQDAPPTSVEVIILAVPDGAVAAAAAALTPGPVVGHCSGALDLEALAPHAERFSLHPLMTLTAQSTADDLRGAGAAIAASTPHARVIASELAARAGLEPFAVADADRPLYHAGASMASNFLVTLEAIACQVLESVGVEHRHVAALAHASLESWAALGAKRALTGPIARGDGATVARQRAALVERAPELIEVFDALAAATRKLAEAS